MALSATVVFGSLKKSLNINSLRSLRSFLSYANYALLHCLAGFSVTEWLTGGARGHEETFARQLLDPKHVQASSYISANVTAGRDCGEFCHAQLAEFLSKTGFGSQTTKSPSIF